MAMHRTAEHKLSHTSSKLFKAQLGHFKAQRQGAIVIGFIFGVVCTRLFFPSNGRIARRSLGGSVQEGILEWYESAYKTYKEDLSYTAQMAGEYAARKVKSGSTVSSECPEMLGRVEAETLYLWIRSQQPAYVMELAPGCGYATFWILQALEDNGYGEVYSFGTNSQLKDFISDQDPVRGMDRLNFVLGQVQRTTKHIDKPWDVVLINGPNDNHFASWYTADLLPSLKPETSVMVAGIYNPLNIPEFAPCATQVKGGQGIVMQNIQQYTRCIQDKISAINSAASNAEKDASQTLANLLFSPGQPTGAGTALLSYLGSCNCASNVYTLSPFKDRYFAQTFLEARARALGEPITELPSADNPAIFFSHTASVFE